MALIIRVSRLFKADLHIVLKLDVWSDGIDVSKGTYLNFR